MLEGAAFNKERALIERSPDDSSSSLHAQNLNFVSWDVVCCVGGDVGQKLVIYLHWREGAVTAQLGQLTGEVSMMHFVAAEASGGGRSTSTQTCSVLLNLGIQWSSIILIV